MEEKYQSTEHGIYLRRLYEFIRQHGEAAFRIFAFGVPMFTGIMTAALMLNNKH